MTEKSREYKIIQNSRSPYNLVLLERLFHQLYRNKFKMLLKYQKAHLTKIDNVQNIKQ